MAPRRRDALDRLHHNYERSCQRTQIVGGSLWDCVDCIHFRLQIFRSEECTTRPNKRHPPLHHCCRGREYVITRTRCQKLRPGYRHVMQVVDLEQNFGPIQRHIDQRPVHRHAHPFRWVRYNKTLRRLLEQQHNFSNPVSSRNIKSNLLRNVGHAVHDGSFTSTSTRKKKRLSAVINWFLPS